MALKFAKDHSTERQGLSAFLEPELYGCLKNRVKQKRTSTLRLREMGDVHFLSSGSQLRQPWGEAWSPKGEPSADGPRWQTQEQK